MYSINLSKTEKVQSSIDNLTIRMNDDTHPIDVREVPQGGFSIKVDHKSHYLHVSNIDYKNKTATFLIDNTAVEVRVEEPIDLLLQKMGISMNTTKKVDSIKAPMPGLVLNILVSEGDTIQKGQPILVLEAMKMENVFKAPVDATIKTLKVKAGDAVEKGAVMIELS